MTQSLYNAERQFERGFNQEAQPVFTDAQEHARQTRENISNLIDTTRRELLED